MNPLRRFGLAALGLVPIVVMVALCVAISHGQTSIGPISVPYPNSSNGTLCNSFAKIDQTAGTTTLGRAVSTAAGDNLIPLGVVTRGCGTSGTATIVMTGQITVLFDTASVNVGDAVGLSLSVGGSAADLGSQSPSSSAQVVGTIILNPSGTQPSACTVAPGCRIQLSLGGGGSGGSVGNAVVTNPTASQTIAQPSSTSFNLTGGPFNVNSCGSNPCIPLTLTGDAFGSDILDLYAHGEAFPDIKIQSLSSGGLNYITRINNSTFAQDVNGITSITQISPFGGSIFGVTALSTAIALTVIGDSASDVIQQWMKHGDIAVARIDALGNFQTVATTFSTLPTCASGTEGTQRAISDSTTNTWGATITGSGADHVLAYCDGTNWTVGAK